MTARRRAGAGRHDLARVPELVSGYPALPSSVHNSAANVQPVAIADAYDVRRRVRALARIDLLDRLRREGRVDEAAYLVGREVERVFEQMSRVGGGRWFEGDRIEGSTAAEIRALLGAERAFAVNSFLAWLVRHVGPKDAYLLWTVLGLRTPFAAIAVAWWPKRRGVRGLRYCIDRFCDALAMLADAKAARGLARPAGASKR
jgi:hypothetical protein